MFIGILICYPNQRITSDFKHEYIYQKVDNTTDEMNYNEGMEKQEMKEEHGKSSLYDGQPPRSPADDNTLRERSTSNER